MIKEILEKAKIDPLFWLWHIIVLPALSRLSPTMMYMGCSSFMMGLLIIKSCNFLPSKSFYFNYPSITFPSYLT